MVRDVSALTVGHPQGDSLACAKIVFMLKFIACTQDTGHLIPELISFEERLNHKFLDATTVSTAT